MKKEAPKSPKRDESRVRWYCMACGRLSAIGDKPVRNPCKCADRGDA